MTTQTDARTSETPDSVDTANSQVVPTLVDFECLADRVLDGGKVTREEALSILATPDDQILSLLQAGFRIRQRHFGKTVQLYFLMNAKSGLCPEDCTYCSQSKVSDAEIPKYNILSRDKLMLMHI